MAEESQVEEAAEAATRVLEIDPQSAKAIEILQKAEKSKGRTVAPQ